jgi:hypothetical protein
VLTRLEKVELNFELDKLNIDETADSMDSMMDEYATALPISARE